MKIDKAYRYIKKLVTDGTWDPDTAINVNEITETLNISRTPIHKALSKLEDEGFLKIIPQVGVFVKKPDYDEVHERLLVCANLEYLMTEQAALKISDEQLAKLENLLVKMERPEMTNQNYANLNTEFHRTIYEASNLHFTLNFAKQFWDYLNYVGNPDILFVGEKRKKSQTEHWMIYYSLKDRNSKMAKSLMEMHNSRVASIVLEKYVHNDSN
ncbi:GntR family transcriptional regulator [Paenibacillus sp. 2RAB27]|uniref:GntR family transcriptional regulator n=1 Tax=Paenibacillus sp. 2RAB27 TaxID=3232991 RepID=UPI003F963361